MKKSAKPTRAKIGRDAAQNKTAKKSAKKKLAVKKEAVKKIVLGYRAPTEGPGKVGRGERLVDSMENWPRVGRRLSRENQLLSDLAAEVRQFREAKGLSVTQLAKSLNAAPATLIKFEEKNRAIPIKLLLQLCDKLGVSLHVSAQN